MSSAKAARRKRPTSSPTPSSQVTTPLATAPKDVRLGARSPVHPGRFLETRFLEPMGISQQTLARELGISRRRVNELIRGHRAITPDTAIRLAVFWYRCRFLDGIADGLGHASRPSGLPLRKDGRAARRPLGTPR